MIIRILIGAVAATLIALLAKRARSLSTSGAIAAIVIGTIAAAAGWSWAIVLILYFASSTALSKVGRVEKEQRTASVVEKGGERDAAQVNANGFVFTVAALGMCFHQDIRWIALGAGALAASAADTWATEIGTLYGGQPRSILTGRRIAPGTSGGISFAGTAASVAGALFLALLSFAGNSSSDHRASLAWAVFIAGVFGSLFDSLLGATVQLRRWCETCQRETERNVHDCGATTIRRRGLAVLNNDAVNFLSTLVGGLLAAALVR
ncbi:MAG TPA: DUF92 domain-containing protein [Gemmatimonadaceae bacterium]|jgi:uncharacterized protein (TIGR00297 family)